MTARRPANGSRRHLWGTAWLMAAGAILAGCAFGPPPPDQSGEPPRLPSPSAAALPSPDEQATTQILATHLVVPWGIAFLPDGSGLVTERNTGKVLHIVTDQPGGTQISTAASIPTVVTTGDAGLRGIAVSPAFRTDQSVYVFYTTATDNRIARITLSGSTAPPVPVLTGIPRGTTDNGGRLAFGPDGMLYATTGDAGMPGLAQDPKSLAGKVLRMTPAGQPAPGNPTSTVVYASGFHDPQGLTFDPLRRLYVTDLGATAWDELDDVRAGGDYGWPAAEGVAHNSRYVDPLVQWPPATASCAGLAAQENTLITACLRGQRLYAVELTKSGGTFGAAQSLLIQVFGRLRTVAAAPDGSLWVTTSNRDGLGTPTPQDDQIIRVIPAGSAQALS